MDGRNDPADAETERVARELCDALGIDPDALAEGEVLWRQFVDMAVTPIARGGCCLALESGRRKFRVGVEVGRFLCHGSPMQRGSPHVITGWRALMLAPLALPVAKSPFQPLPRGPRACVRLGWSNDVALHTSLISPPFENEVAYSAQGI